MPRSALLQFRQHPEDTPDLAVAQRLCEEFLDALGARGIATIRLEPGELERELAAFGP